MLSEVDVLADRAAELADLLAQIEPAGRPAGSAAARDLIGWPNESAE